MDRHKCLFLFGWPDVMWAAPGVIPSSRGIQSVIPQRSVEELVTQAQAANPQIVVITGGEPADARPHRVDGAVEECRSSGSPGDFGGASLQRHL